MQESYGEGLANHPDPESCGSGRKASAEALTGAHAGQPSSCEIGSSGMPTLLSEAKGHTASGAHGEPLAGPAQSETLRMRGNSSHGNRDYPARSGPAEASSTHRSSPICYFARGASHAGSSTTSN
jgi:hypothetical protein